MPVKRGEKLESSLAQVIAKNKPEEWLLAHVESTAEKNYRFRDDAGWFHPSGLYQHCDAKLAFQLLGVEQRGTIPARTIRIFDNGTGRDGYWKQYLQQAGLSIAVDYAINQQCEGCLGWYFSSRHTCLPDLRIRGECDDIIKHPTTGEVSIFEFKTTSTDQYEALKAPFPNHVIQVHPYMVAKGLTSSYIGYENKDNQNFKMYRVNFDVQTWANITDRLSAIIERLKNGYDPERFPMKNEKECPFYWTCSSANFPTLVEEYKKKYEPPT